MRKRVLVTGPLLGDVVERLAAACELVYSKDTVLTQLQFNEQVREAWGVVCMTTLKVDKAVIDSAPHLRIVSNFGVGYENINVSYAGKKGIVVTNMPDVLTETTADLVFALVLSTARRINAGDRMMRAGRFEGWKVDLLLGQDVHGKTMGILGCGRIGQAVARRAWGFNIKLLYHNRERLDASTESALALVYADFDQLLARSDFVVITAPLNEGTHYLFRLETIQKMKRTAVLINAGRGPIIKEDDLVSALQQGLIWGAGLDVYESPSAMAGELDRCPNTTLLPHLGSGTTEARTAMSNLAAQAVLDVFQGRTPQCVVGS